IAGIPTQVWGRTPRREAVELGVRYLSGVVGRYYHEFAFPDLVERTHCILFFDRGYIEIEGWIPERLHGKVIAPAEAIEQAAISLDLPFEVRESGGVSLFDVRFGDRTEAY